MTDVQKLMPVENESISKAEPEDLSSAIVRAMEKRPGETVRCVRAYGDHYRCNWWAKDGDDAVGSVTGRIVRSRFLRVTRTSDGLVIDDLTR